MNESKLLYLAIPYAHPTPEVREHRFRTACRAAAKLMSAGVVVFSPLSHSVSIAEHGDLGEDHCFWMSMDIPILRRCDELLILGIDGWTESKGVRREMFEALRLRKPITVIDEADIDRLPSVPKTARRFLVSKILTEEMNENA